MQASALPSAGREVSGGYQPSTLPASHIACAGWWPTPSRAVSEEGPNGTGSAGLQAVCRELVQAEEGSWEGHICILKEERCLRSGNRQEGPSSRRERLG